MKTRLILFGSAIAALGTFLTVLIFMGNVPGDALTNALPLVIALFAVLVVLAVIFAVIFSRNILLPFKKLHQSIQSFLDGEQSTIEIDSPYGELRTASVSFSELADRLHRYIAGAKQENRKSALILNNISEGLLVLDEDQDVVLINAAARKIFDVDDDITNVNLIHFIRNPELVHKLDTSMQQGKNVHFKFNDPRTERVFRFATSIVPEGTFEGSGTGMMVLISDITDVAQAQQIRKDFSANVSSELKTPLVSIKENARCVEQKIGENTDIAGHLGQIIYEADRLTGLVNDTLKLSALESIDMQETTQAVDLREMSEGVILSLLESIKEKELHVEIHGNAGLRASEEHIREILQNLCENAIRYNVKNGRLIIDLEEDDEDVRIKVTDSGLGIPKDELDRIYERFFRAGNVRNEKDPGTGLGLAIVKHAVGLYDGRISVDSALSVGTVFTVTFPKQ